VRDAAAGRPLRWPSLFEQRDVLAEHFALSRETYGDQRSCALMRKFGIKYAQLHPRHNDVSRAFVAVKSPQEWHDVLTRWYAEDSPGRVPPAESDLVECAPCET
jgi:tRNA-dihydrouridine synthase